MRPGQRVRVTRDIHLGRHGDYLTIWRGDRGTIAINVSEPGFETYIVDLDSGLTAPLDADDLDPISGEATP